MKKLSIALMLMIAAFAVPAQACQLICQKTMSIYDGNLGGLSGADAKCVAELGTGWKFPRTVSLVLNGSNGGASSSSANSLEKFTREYSVSNQYAWLGPWRINAANVHNCSNWSSNSPAVYGGSISNGGTPSTSYTGCDMQLPIICCNM